MNILATIPSTGGDPSGLECVTVTGSRVYQQVLSAEGGPIGGTQIDLAHITPPTAPNFNSVVAQWGGYYINDGGKLHWHSVAKDAAIGMGGLALQGVGGEAFAGVRVVQMATRLANARALGAAGEAAVRAAFDIGPKESINVLGRTRFPDGATAQAISEVKNVSSLALTSQLRDYAMFARETGLDFDLYTRPTTKLSGPLKQLYREGGVNILWIPQ